MQVAAWPVVETVAALAPDDDCLAVVDARRNRYLNGAVFPDQSLTAAGFTRIFDNFACPFAGVADSSSADGA